MKWWRCNVQVDDRQDELGDDSFTFAFGLRLLEFFFYLLFFLFLSVSSPTERKFLRMICPQPEGNFKFVKFIILNDSVETFSSFQSQLLNFSLKSLEFFKLFHYKNIKIWLLIIYYSERRWKSSQKMAPIHQQSWSKLSSNLINFHWRQWKKRRWTWEKLTGKYEWMQINFTLYPTNFQSVKF